MKKLLPTIFLLCLCVFAQAQTTAQQKHLDSLWLNVQRYQVNDLPASALEEVNAIFKLTEKEKLPKQWYKALLYKAQFTLLLGDDETQFEVINEFRMAIADADEPMKAILQSLLAEAYIEYYKANRYTINKRTEVVGNALPEDMAIWGKQHFMAEIILLFQASVSNEELLQQIPIAEYQNILEPYENEALRPTLYDFLAFRAIDLYAKYDNWLPQYFPKDSQKPEYLLGPNKIFLNSWYPGKDSLTFFDKTIKLYRNLTQFHINDDDKTALLDVTLKRLNYVRSQANMPNDEIYIRTLTSIADGYRDYELITDYDFALADWYYKHSANDKKLGDKALWFCNRAIAAFLNSEGAKNCQSLKEVILGQELSMNMEEYVVPDQRAFAYVEYRNVDTLYVKVYKITNVEAITWRGGIKPSYYYFNYDRRSLQEELKDPVKSWSQYLPSQQDYNKHSTEIVIPELPQGHYVISVTPNKSWNTTDDIIYRNIEVCPVAILETSGYSESKNFRMVDRVSGIPVKKQELRMMYFKEDTLITSLDKKTDKYGNVSFEFNNSELKRLFSKSSEDKAYYVYSTVQTIVAKDTFTFVNELMYSFQFSHPGMQQQKEEIDSYEINTHLFTDRPIYRPGQTVYFKAILTKTLNDKVTTPFTKEYVDVFLEDDNGTEVTRVTLQLNEFGSVAGEFTIPKSGITGEYTITVEENEDYDSDFYDYVDYDFDYDNEIDIQVEEYKRPKFEATFKPVTETYKVNDSIHLKGEAKAFAGSNITNAKVTYTVKRSIRMPWWYNGNYNWGDVDKAQGETTTDAQGNFTVSFLAKPDAEQLPENQPVFTYEVKVWVTDSNGESHEAETKVKVGFHTLQTEVQVKNHLATNKVNTFSVVTTNLNGEPIGATGTVYLYKNPAPDAPKRERLWRAPELPILTEAEFNALFPYDWYKDKEQNLAWDKQKPIDSIRFDTNKETRYQFPDMSNYKTGDYTLITKIEDNDQIIKTKNEFTLVNPKINEVYDGELFQISTTKPVYEKEEKITFRLGTSAPSLYVYYKLYKDNDVIKSDVLHLQNEVKEISIKGDKDVQKGYAITYHYVWQNSFESGSQKANIFVEAEERLNIITGVFRDKMQPGNEETWSFTISGMENDKDIAEVLAGMYDASLDKFLEDEDHTHWQSYFEELRDSEYYNVYNRVDSKNFKVGRFYNRLSKIDFYGIKRVYGGLNTFGFNLVRQKSTYTNNLNTLRSSFVDTRGRVKYAKIIRGTVTDMDGLPLPGVSVMIKGTAFGTTTDFDGNYSIKVRNEDVLEYSYVGFNTGLLDNLKAVEVGNVSMSMDDEALDEVVVVGYGVQRKLEVTGAIHVVKSPRFLPDSTYYVYKTVLTANERYKPSATKLRNGIAEFKQAKGDYNGIAGWSDDGGGSNSDVSSLRFESGFLSMDSFKGKKLILIDGVIATEESLGMLDMDALTRFELISAESAKASYGVDAPDGAVVIVTQEGQAALEAQLANIKARTDLKETAFFFPQLTTNDKGEVTFTFTSPEALTQWKLQLLAHTKNLRIGYKQLTAVTQKELMVLPNLPRFVREGDTITISTKISNLTTEAKTGNVQLVLFNPVTGEELKDMVVANQTSQPFTTEAQGNTTASWQLAIPEGLSALQCKIVAVSEAFSDGEQSVLPVLKNKILVTESVAVTIAGTGEKTVTLDKLKNNTSKTLQHHALTLEVTDNAVWYAVQALPYLMEFPYECAEQTFSRLYANLLAGEIVNQHPKIKEVFEKWKAQGELQSKLEQNEELKNILLQESPWVRDAQSEAEQQQRIALLFDLAKLKTQTTENLLKLDEMQLYDGGFPWFQGGKYPSRYITQHIIEGMAELNKLGLLEGETLTDIYHNGLKYLTSAVVNDFDNLNNQLEQEAVKSKKTKKQLLSKKHLSVMQLRYLYARSFFPEDSLKTEASKAAYDYYYGQATQYWTGASLYEKGLTALVLFRNGDTATANKILKSITEYATTKDGIMYWNANMGSYAQTAIENHAFLISVYKEIAPDNANIPMLKAWLLQHKTLHSWQTTKATAKAIYALLETEELPTETAVVTTSLGGKAITPDAQQSGTGYYKKVWTGDEVIKAGSELTLTSAKSMGLATAALHWQYFEEANEITEAGKGISVTKSLYIKQLSGNKATWVPVENHRIKVGDIVKVRLILKTDKDISYVHLKDMRAAGMEPVDVLSEYKYQDGLYYYQSTRDAATNFFFEEMAKGTYVFEYDVKANNEGVFSAGICTLQSMYAPEVNAHSNGLQVVILPQN